MAEQREYTSRMAEYEKPYNLVILTRDDLTSDFTNDEYNTCISAIASGYRVLINCTLASGTVIQVPLVQKGASGSLSFEYTKDERCRTYTVSASSPHTVTSESYAINNSVTPIVTTGTKIATVYLNGAYTDIYGGQIVINHADLSVPFSDDEYNLCIDNAGKVPIMLTYSSGGTICANLTRVNATGDVYFSTQYSNVIKTIIVSFSGIHGITVYTSTLS